MRCWEGHATPSSWSSPTTPTSSSRCRARTRSSPSDPCYRHAYECDVECVEYAEALTESEALIADLERLSKEAPDVKRHTGNFEPVETVKSVTLDPSNNASKKVRIGSELDPK
jgi:hypothetical protein